MTSPVQNGMSGGCGHGPLPRARASALFPRLFPTRRVPAPGRNVLRTTRALAGLLCVLIYAGAAWLVLHGSRRVDSRATEVQAPLILTFAQMELQAATPSSPEPVEIPPEPEPEPVPMEEPPPPEPEPVSVEEPPQPDPEPVPAMEPPVPDAQAQVDQQAAATEFHYSEPDALRRWVEELLEQEKRYPPAAVRAGYEGRFTVRVAIGPSGHIERAEITGGQGPRLLRNTLNGILDGLAGRRYPEHPPAERVEFLFGFEFKLE